MASVLDSMYPADIYDMWNERLVADQYFVETIIASIKFNIWYNVQNQLNNWFIYDCDEWLINQDQNTKLRVIDQVIKYFRSRGIRIYVNNTFHFAGDPTVYPGAMFNSDYALSTVVKVEWLIRQGTEYMKSYV